MTPFARTWAKSHALEHTVGDTRRSARAGGYLQRAARLYLYTEYTGAARNYARKLLRRVQLEPERHAEPVAQRRGELA